MNNEDFEIEVVDTYYWRINYYPPEEVLDEKGLHMSDYDALEIISKIVGMKVSNTHVSRDGIWLEGDPILPRRQRKQEGNRRP